MCVTNKVKKENNMSQRHIKKHCEKMKIISNHFELIQNDRHIWSFNNYIEKINNVGSCSSKYLGLHLQAE